MGDVKNTINVMVIYSVHATHIRVFVETIDKKDWEWMKLCHDNIWNDGAFNPRKAGGVNWPLEYAHWEMNEWIHKHTPVYDSEFIYSADKTYQMPFACHIVYTGVI